MLCITSNILGDIWIIHFPFFVLRVVTLCHIVSRTHCKTIGIKSSQNYQVKGGGGA